MRVANSYCFVCIASEKYDKTHPSAPNLEGFNGPLSPGAFRELMKRAFGIYLNPKEVGAILQRFHQSNNLNMFDGKKFIIYFIKLGFDSRAQRKAQVQCHPSPASPPLCSNSKLLS